MSDEAVGVLDLDVEERVVCLGQVLQGQSGLSRTLEVRGEDQLRAWLAFDLAQSHLVLLPDFDRQDDRKVQRLKSLSIFLRQCRSDSAIFSTSQTKRSTSKKSQFVDSIDALSKFHSSGFYILVFCRCYFQSLQFALLFFDEN